MVFPGLLSVLTTLAVTAAAIKECPMPNMSVGDYNITSEAKWKKFARENEVFVLGVSANWCLHCCASEPWYEELHAEL
jgi:hypothetical protein